MFDRIEELRRKSEAHRKRVAFSISSGIMLVIVGIWAVTFPTRFPELVPGAQARVGAMLNNQDTANNTASPLEALREGFSNGTQNFAQAIGGTTTPANQTVSNGVIITDPNADTSNDLQIVK